MSKSIGTNIPNTSLERRSIVASGSKYQRVLSPRDIIKAVIAVRIHLFPFRTEKLSSLAPMVLLHQVGE